MVNYQGTSDPIALDNLWDVPCIRCGSPSQCQWTVCANNGHYLPLCLDCDIALNRLVLCFLNIEPDAFIDDYVAKLTSKGLMDGCDGENSPAH